MGSLEEYLGFTVEQVDRLQEIGRQWSKATDTNAELLLAIHDDTRLSDVERDYLLFQTGLNFGYREYVMETVETQEITELLMNSLR